MNNVHANPGGDIPPQGTPAHTMRIRHLNDQLRHTFEGGRVLLSHDIAALPERDRLLVLGRVRGFSQFSEANDPYGEHDFGAFEHAGQTINWKIDYYDRKLEFLSDDPADPAQTIRVLTICFAHEW